MAGEFGKIAEMFNDISYDGLTQIGIFRIPIVITESIVGSAVLQVCHIVHTMQTVDG